MNKDFIKPKVMIVLLIIVSIFSFIGFNAYLFITNSQSKPLPTYWNVESFQLTDSKKENFNSDQLNNKIWVADFFFTTCSTICPIMTKNMVLLHNKYKSNKDVEFVSISVNPEQDTPEVLSRFAEKYQANSPKWHFLTGARSDIKNLAVKSFKIGSVEEPIFHSPSFVLVDRRARIRGYYDGTIKEEIMELSKDLDRLLKEEK